VPMPGTGANPHSASSVSFQSHCTPLACAANRPQNLITSSNVKTQEARAWPMSLVSRIQTILLSETLAATADA
jgi:hypothetical protein